MRLFLAMLAVAVFCASCGQEDTKPITQSRTVDTLPKPPATGVSSAERFGYASRPQPSPHAPAQKREGAFSWTAPASWQKAPDRSMREVTFLAAPNVECYVSIFGKAAGDVEANVNRWRSQMEQEPLPPEAIQALPLLDVLGRPSPLVEIEGSFTPMGGETITEAMFFAVLCPLDDATVFVKMTGPAEAVRPERDRFVTFCESLRREKP